MEHLRKRATYNLQRHLNTFRAKLDQGGSTSRNERLTIAGLGLLNVVLLIAAVVIGIDCAKVKEGSLHVSHSTVKQLITELDFLRSNHSDVIEAEEEAKKALERALKNHTQIKEQIEQLKTINDGYVRQIQTLQTEQTNLKSNISALGSCGRCLSGWVLLDTSCYFFSYMESTVKKNWSDSRADCIGRGADMVVIDNLEEQLNLFEFIPARDLNVRPWWSRPGSIWIGLTDLQTERTWVWVNNTTLTDGGYWIIGEPNNHMEEDCAAFLKNDNPRRTWFDSNCQEDKEWLCEMKPN